MRRIGSAILIGALCLAGTGRAAELAAQPTADLFAPEPAAERGGFVDEIRLGAGLFADERPEVREDGVFLSGEILFGKFVAERDNRILNVLLRPRPHVGGLVSTDGGTNQIYAGLTWDVPLTERLSIEASFGGTLHDGRRGRAPVQNGPELGCSLHFRESLALAYDVTDRWRVVASVDHSSNSGICSPNDGLTHVGLWAGYRF